MADTVACPFTNQDILVDDDSVLFPSPNDPNIWVVHYDYYRSEGILEVLQSITGESNIDKLREAELTLRISNEIRREGDYIFIRFPHVPKVPVINAIDLLVARRDPSGQYHKWVQAFSEFLGLLKQTLRL